MLNYALGYAAMQVATVREMGGRVAAANSGLAYEPGAEMNPFDVWRVAASWEQRSRCCRLNKRRRRTVTTFGSFLLLSCRPRSQRTAMGILTGWRSYRPASQEGGYSNPVISWFLTSTTPCLSREPAPRLLNLP
jgi:hypothetical protein